MLMAVFKEDVTFLSQTYSKNLLPKLIRDGSRTAATSKMERFVIIVTASSR